MPYTDRFLVRKIGLSFEFTNPTTLPAYYKLYAVVLKKECLDAAPAITNWTQGLLQMGATTGQTPVVLSSTGAVGGESAYMVGSLPQWSRQFRDYCKIVKEVSFELPAGSTKKMDFNIHANKIIKHELVAKVAPVAYALGNITMEFFIVGHGALTIHTGGTHDYDVQYGIPKLLVATQTVYHCAQLTGQKNVVLSLLAANRMETTNIIGNLQQINNVDVPDVEKTVA